MHKIYKMTFPSGKCYIGRTKQRVSVRMAQHRYDARYRREDQALHRAIRKYGEHSFTVEVIGEVSTYSAASKLELHFIDECNSVRNGYNNTKHTDRGGDIWEGRKNDEDYKQFVKKMREINKGKANGMFGKKHTAEARQKQKEKAKGRFSLPWFIDRYGKVKGTKKYKARCKWLSERKMNRTSSGHFSS